MERSQVITNLIMFKKSKINSIVENIDALKNLLSDCVSPCEYSFAFDEFIPAIISNYDEIKAIEQINIDAIL